IKSVSIGPRATRFAVTILGIKSKSTIPTSGCSAPSGPISSRPRSRSTEQQTSRVTRSQNATTIATWPFSNASRQQSKQLQHLGGKPNAEPNRVERQQSVINTLRILDRQITCSHTRSLFGFTRVSVSGRLSSNARPSPDQLAFLSRQQVPARQVS